MISRLGLVLSLALLMLSSNPAAEEALDCELLDGGPAGCLVITRWSTSVDEELLIVYRMPAQGRFEDEAGGLWDAQLTPYCRGNLSGTVIIDYGMCQNALLTCELRGSDAIAAMWMVLTPIFVGPLPRAEGPICLDGTAAIPIGPQIQALVEGEIGTDPPPIVLQPTDAIVNLPMLASTDPRPPIVIDVSDPISGTAQATPEFLWAFAEGAAAHGPGLPYDGTSPTENPGYYVAHTYAGLGTPTIELTVTWQVTFTIPGYPPVELDDVVREATASTQVRAAGSELVGD